MSGAERRQHPRLEYAVPVKISGVDADIVTETANISCSGALCRIGKYLAPMTKLMVHLLLPLRKGAKTITKRVHCGGVVVRAQSAPQEDFFYTAIFFNDIKPRDSAVLAEFLSGIIKG